MKPTDSRDTVDPLEKLLPDGSFATVGKVFALVEVAEEEINLAVEKHPEKADLLRAAFQEHLFPGELTRFGSTIYRSHAREVLERVAAGDDPKPGTMAECLVSLSLASLKAPLASGYLAAMEKAFKHVFPNHARVAESENLGREAWAGETEEILNELRKKIGRMR